LQVITDGYGPGKELKPAEEAAPPIHEKMKGIFKDDLDLLEKFETFLPGNLAVEPSGHTANELAPELDAEPVD
jgi:histone deacetylase complex regulatory component SIN3